MGQLIIEVPQNINLKVSVKSVEIVDEILRLVKIPKKKLETTILDLPDDLKEIDESEAVGIWADREGYGEIPAFIPPRRNSLKRDLAKAVGIWADREESADAIARTIRDKNNGKI